MLKSSKNSLLMNTLWAGCGRPQTGFPWSVYCAAVLEECIFCVLLSSLGYWAGWWISTRVNQMPDWQLPLQLQSTII